MIIFLYWEIEFAYIIIHILQIFACIMNNNILYDHCLKNTPQQHTITIYNYVVVKNRDTDIHNYI